MSLSVDIEKKLGAFTLHSKFEAPDETMALLGASGCGKSMTLKCIAGIVTPDRGRIVLGDRVLFDSEKKINLPPQQRKVGYLFQQYALFPNMSVEQNILCGIRSGDKAEKRRVLAEKIRMFRLEGLEKEHPAQLSGGQQQRVALARAVVIEPSVLLFDEPLSNLDAKLRESMRDELRALQQRLGITSLYVTHDQSEAMAISDKVVIMKDGVICQQGTPQEIYEQPASRFVANFIGKANFIDGIFKGRDGEAALVEIGGKTFSIPAPGKMEGVEVGGACCLTVRPESFLLTKDAGALPGTVSRATYYGAKIEYEVMLDEQPIIVEVYNPQLTERFSVGDTVTMSLIEGCVRVLK